jgi:outer membrane protein assembly factor BamB
MFRTMAIALTLTAAVALAVYAQEEQWNQWRGPQQRGVTEVKNLPVKWDDGENVDWKMKLPGPSSSQPVLWGDHVYVTSFSGFAPGGMDLGETRVAEGLRYHVTCLKWDTGEVVWDREVEPLNPLEQKSRNIAYHGWTTPTPVVDAERVYCSFGTGGVFCFDHEGEEFWHTSVGKDMPDWGYAASPIGHEELLIVNACVESGRLLALDKATGKEVWSNAEGLGQGMNQITRSTPLIYTNAQGQVRMALMVVGHSVQVYEPATGKIIWKEGRWSGGYASNTPVPNEDGSILYVMTGGSHGNVGCAAVRTGDSVENRIVWEHKNRGTALVPPVLYKGRLYYGAYGGVKPNVATGFVCMDPATGDVLWQLQPDGFRDFIYTPAFAGDGKVYIQTQLSGVWVFGASDEMKLLSQNILDEDKVTVEMKLASRHTGNESGNGFVAMPVPLPDGRLLLHGYWGLYCISAAQ